MRATARKDEGRTTSDPLGIDPLATIAFLAGREQLSERLGEVSTVRSPRPARRRRAWRAALARWIHELAAAAEDARTSQTTRAPETPSSQPTA